MRAHNQPTFSKPHAVPEQNVPTNELLQLLLKHTDEVFFLVDRNYKILVSSPATSQKIKTLSGQELQAGTMALDLIEPEKRQQIKAIFDRVFEGETVDYEGEIKNQSADIIYYHNRYKPVQDEKGQIIGALVTVSNITENKKAAQDLLEREQRWRFALEGSNHGLWDWNLKTGDVFFSQSWKDLFGFANNDISGRIEEWESRIHPEDRQTMKENLQNHISSQNPYFESVYRFQAKNGRYRWILARGMMIETTPDGAPLRMIGTHTDITDQRMLEENYRLLFNANPLPMWTYDLETLRFLDVNEAALKHYGYSKSEFLSMTVLDIFPAGEATQNTLEVEKRKSLTEIFTRNLKHQKKNGDIITVNVSGHVLERDNRKYVLILAEDVTQQVRAEEKLRQSEEEYKALFQNNPLPTWIYEFETLRFLKVNEAAIAHYGYSKEEFLKMTLADLHPEDQVGKLHESLADGKDQQQVYLTKRQHRKRNGDIIYVDIKRITIQHQGREARLLVAHDVTAMVLAEMQLQVSNNRFELAARAASEALWEWDVKNDSVYISPVYKDMFGFEIDPTRKYVEWEEYIHPNDRKQVLESFYGTLKDPSKDHWQYEYRYLKADGSYLFVVDHCLIIRNEAGEVVRVVGAMQDITQRKQAENEIAISNERFVLASKATSDAIYDWNIITNELVWGEGIYNLFGYQPEQVTQENWERFIHEEEQQSVIKCLYETIYNAEKKFWKKEYRFRKQDGEYRYVVEKGFIVRDEAGTPLRMIGAVQDITEIKQKEIELTKSNERFDAVIKATSDLIWDWDLENNNFYRDIEGVNKVFGVADANDIAHLPEWLERVHPADVKKLKNVIANILKATTQKIFEVEYRFKRDDGRYAYINDRGIIICNPEGKPVRMIGAAQDITLRKTLEQQLLQKELEKQKIISKATIDTQEQERGEIGKELHDNVNQVLTTTKLYLELAQNNPELQNELITKSIHNVVYVIDEIRQLSRSLMDPSIGDLGLLDAIKDLIQNITVTKQLQITLKASKEVESVMSKDLKLMVFRILQEALNNTIRHAHATQAAVTISKKEKLIEMTIQDNGIGFNVNTTKKGAGLKNIQNRVYLASGSLQIDSAPGKGCQLTINFPFTKKH